MSVILVRDDDSSEVASSLAPSLRQLKGADLTFILADDLSASVSGKARENKLVVSVLPYAPLAGVGRVRSDRLLDGLAKAIDTIPDLQRPDRVQLLGLYSGRRPNDRDAANDLGARIRSLPVETTVVSTPREAIREMACARAVLVGRYHALLFAYLSNTPVGVISHQRKMSSLCGVIGIPRRQWLALEAEATDRALERLVVATLEAAPLPPRSAELAGDARISLQRFLDDVAAIVVRRRA